MRACLLCGKTADSLEHFIPKWLSLETGRGKDPIEIGTALNGQMVSQSSRGCSLAAKHRNLCTKCNIDLGSSLEGPVKAILSPLVAPAPKVIWNSYLALRTLPERTLLVWWTLLRAVQLNEQFPNPRITDKNKSVLISGLKRVRDGVIPPAPGGVFVEVAHASESVWGFMLSRKLYDRARAQTVVRDGSFLWAMQANHCLLVAVSAPEARLLKDQGWGHGISPRDTRGSPQYVNMKDMLERSHIDTSVWLKAGKPIHFPAAIRREPDPS